MKKLLLGIAVLASAMLFGASGAKAVMWGQVDEGNQFSYVGMMLAYDADGNPLWRCSGSLLSEDVYLTAGHCVYDSQDPPATVGIWFDVRVPATDPQYLANLDADVENPCAGVSGYPCGGYDAIGEPVPHPDYADFAGFPNTHDVGLVIDLQWVGDQPAEFGTLAAPGTLDALATRRGLQDTTFTVVGYGLQSVVPVTSAQRVRYYGTVQLVNLRSALTDGFNLAHTGAPGKGTGGSGTCFGDSGGPVLYGDDIVAVTSFGLNSVCMGPGFAYRTDRQEIYDWILGYVD